MLNPAKNACRRSARCLARSCGTRRASRPDRTGCGDECDLEPLLAARQANILLNLEIGLGEDRRPAVGQSPVIKHWRAADHIGLAADRDAARRDERQAHSRLRWELVVEVRLELVRTVGVQSAKDRLRAVVERHVDGVEEARHVRRGPGNLVGAGKSRVVAIEPAQRVAGVGFPSTREALSQLQFDRVVVALDLRQRRILRSEDVRRRPIPGLAM